MDKNYDVVILGGGLAGLTLALQLKKSQPDISIKILEMRKAEALTAAHKVGESTVELGTYYLREVLGLKDYLEKEHLPKYGLRFFFSPEMNDQIERRVEYGAGSDLHVPSHQLDRGILENDLEKMVIDLGVEVQLGARVTNVDFSEEGHTVEYQKGMDQCSEKAKWVVDASGRSNIIKRKESLMKDIEHHINTAWFRVNGNFDMDSWSADKEWASKLRGDFRRLGTVHFMGKGYWLWFIPLSSGITSIGIVADPRFHDFDTFNTLDAAFEWIKKHEPQCYEILNAKRDDVLDFKKLRKYSYNCEQFYSSENWALVGEAGAFLDPFYSPGTDFISLSNSWTADLILRDYNGEDIHTRSIIYDRVHKQLFNNWIPVYYEKYELYDNAQVMTAKITWDFAVYWGIPSLSFTNGAFTDIEVLRSLFTVKNSFGQRFGALNKVMQDFYLDWGRRENEPYVDQYFDPLSVSFMKGLQTGIERMHESSESLINQLESNLTLLTKMGSELFRCVSHRLNGTPADMPVNIHTMQLNSTKEELISQSADSDCLAYDLDIAEALSPIWLSEKLAV